MNNPMDLQALANRTRSFDWKAYFRSFGITPSARILVATPRFFGAIDQLRKDFKPAQWASYFTYHLLIDTASALPKAFDDEAFALEKLVQGTPQQRPRADRCVKSVSTFLGDLVGKHYVEKNFPPASRQAVRTLFDAVMQVMHEELGTLDWMSPPTRNIAQDKLAKLVPMIGYPDKWRRYDFAVKRGDFGGNLLRGAAFEVKRTLAKSGKPYDRGEWYSNAFDANAYYNSSANNTALLAGILQGACFGPDRALAVNMGGIGLVIGHELTHGFDDQGAKMDANGNLKNWWAPEDKAKFEAKGRCVAEQYSTFEVLPQLFVNGELTLGENIADLGGTKMAYRAYKRLRHDASQPIVADGFTEDQLFFLSTAQLACSRVRPDEMRRHIAADVHSPPRFRTYGPLRNLPEFAQAFSCAAGTPMRPAQTCSVW
jgi:putative endopeptidase